MSLEYELQELKHEKCSLFLSSNEPLLKQNTFTLIQKIVLNLLLLLILFILLYLIRLKEFINNFYIDSRNQLFSEMEKVLNSRNSESKNQKSYKKMHASKSSLDDAILWQFDIYNTPATNNKRSSFKHSIMRNTMNNMKSLTKSQQMDLTKLKNNKNNNSKKPALKQLVNRHHRYSASYFTSTVIPNNKSKYGSVLNFQQNHISTQEIAKYKFIYQIGFGGFGKVWKVIKKKSFKQYAMKQISKKRVLQKDNVQSILNQRYILSSLNHPFLINMYSAFQDNANLYLTMDYLRGADLRYHICYKQNFTQPEIKFIIANIIIGLEYMHQKGIIHRDIKPENIVFQQSGYVRITDFGIAKMQSSSNLPAKFESSGTPGYMAPQILCKMSYSFQSDFFALGVIVYELIMGHRPYDGKNRQQIRQNILKHQATLSQQQLPRGFNNSVTSLINKLLSRNPQQRLGYNGIKQIKSHKWLKDIKWKSLQRKQIIPPFKPNVVCQTKQYLDEIVLYNQMQSNDQNNQCIIPADQIKFEDYDFKKTIRQKLKTQKTNHNTNKHTAENSLAQSKSKQFLTKNNSQVNLSNLLLKPCSSTNNFFKKNRRNSQEKM